MSAIRVLQTMRQQAWERAKGELQATLVTFYEDQDKYTLAREAIDEFVAKVDGEGLLE